MINIFTSYVFVCYNNQGMDSTKMYIFRIVGNVDIVGHIISFTEYLAYIREIQLKCVFFYILIDSKIV